MIDIIAPLPTREDPRFGLQDALAEIRRVIVGQDAMLERLLVCLLTRRSRPAGGRSRAWPRR